uniref:ATP synthase subunit a n=2 Tax=Cletus TaxID=237098 RepID=A0A7L7YX46_9HEMI|nr:ATP synthase F0 subunit 6 [Cletus punctiger]YP_010032688.1 ATP synthase F0 subunit 6 [Cletus rubidiventris]QOD41599.1 ATP synthase F0 subunit 6 [Cletus punctiger]QOW08009.1 ATP synthase F0 subunit 6 [Cletus rubidiventris]
MMTNLFSTFDPATSSYLSMNWVSTISCFILIPLSYWMLPNRLNSLFNTITMKLNEEFKMLMGPNSKGMTLIMISLFMFILINNIMGLLPYIFTSSSHLVFTLTMALPLWLSFMIFGWYNHTNHMFAHLIPAGTPAILMPFMVMIETISNLIRPGSLAVRLTANMIAGHLLMSLLGNNSVNAQSIIIPMILMVQIGLMLFESAVSLIQAYVFSILSTLYSSEVM